MELQLKLSNELLGGRKDQGKAFAIINAAHASRRLANDSPENWVLMKEALFQVVEDRSLPYETRKASNLELATYFPSTFPKKTRIQVYASPDPQSQKFRMEIVKLWQKEMHDCSFITVTGPENDGIWDTNDFHFGIDYDLIKNQELGRQFAAAANRILPVRGDFLFLEQFPNIGMERDADIRVYINAHMWEHNREETERTDRFAKAKMECFDKHPAEARKISEMQHSRR